MTYPSHSLIFQSRSILFCRGGAGENRLNPVLSSAHDVDGAQTDMGPRAGARACGGLAAVLVARHGSADKAQVSVRTFTPPAPRAFVAQVNAIGTDNRAR